MLLGTLVDDRIVGLQIQYPDMKDIPLRQLFTNHALTARISPGYLLYWRISFWDEIWDEYPEGTYGENPQQPSSGSVSVTAVRWSTVII